MSWVAGARAIRAVGGALFVLGVLAVIIGFLTSVSPEIVERTLTIPHREVVVDRSRVSVDPLSYFYVRFNVPPEARSAFLDISVTLYSGPDIEVEVYRYSSRIFYRKVYGSLDMTVSLPGPGPYELRLDNSYSLLTPKEVGVRAVLRWSEVRVEKQTVSGKAADLIVWGSTLTITGLVTYLIGVAAGRVGPKREDFASVLLDIAARGPPPAGGPEVTLKLKLKPRGLSRSDISNMLKVIAESRGVSLSVEKRRFSLTYRVEVRGAREAASTAAKDLIEICRRTGKCEAKLEP